MFFCLGLVSNIDFRKHEKIVVGKEKVLHVFVLLLKVSNLSVLNVLVYPSTLNQYRFLNNLQRMLKWINSVSLGLSRF